MRLHFDVVGHQTAYLDEVAVRDGDDLIDTLVFRLDAPVARSLYLRDFASRFNGNGPPFAELERALGELAQKVGGRGVMVRLDTVRPEPVAWLWPNRIPLGKITILDGDPGVGKSLITVDLAARVSTGRPMPDHTPGVSAGGVVLLSAEDGLADTIKPRLDAAGADCSRIVALTTVRSDDGEQLPCLPDDLALIEETIAKAGAKLLIIDPLIAYLGEQTNSWRDQDVRRALAPVAALAERTGAAVLIVRHLNKSTTMSPLYRGGGSIGIIGAARAGLVAGHLPTDPSGVMRFLANSKSNLGPPAEPLAWSIESAKGVPVVAWGTGIPDFDLAAALSGTTSREPDEAPRLEEAEAFLQDVLMDGPVAAKLVLRRAKESGISERTLNRAQGTLGVISGKDGFGEAGAWSWRLPEHRQRRPEPAPDSGSGAPDNATQR